MSWDAAEVSITGISVIRIYRITAEVADLEKDLKRKGKGK